MKIKTITRKLGDANSFDDAVNAALAEGWTLIKRAVLQPPSQPGGGTFFYVMLYAELEKRDEGEYKPTLEEINQCATCGHLDDCSGYCDNCTKGIKWEPAI